MPSELGMSMVPPLRALMTWTWSLRWSGCLIIWVSAMLPWVVASQSSCVEPEVAEDEELSCIMVMAPSRLARSPMMPPVPRVNTVLLKFIVAPSSIRASRPRKPSSTVVLFTENADTGDATPVA